VDNVLAAVCQRWTEKFVKICDFTKECPLAEKKSLLWVIDFFTEFHDFIHQC